MATENDWRTDWRQIMSSCINTSRLECKEYFHIQWWLLQLTALGENEITGLGGNESYIDRKENKALVDRM